MYMAAQWMSFSDREFKEKLGKDFYHEDLVSREGWAKYYFKGKYDKDVAYVRLQIVNPQTGMLIRTFFFQFRKSYQTSLDARYYVTDPILGDKIVKNGLLIELRRFKKSDGGFTYRKSKTTFKQTKIADVLSSTRKEQVNTSAIIQHQVRYSEKPKMIFLVTPPHLMKYAKLILILIKQLVDLNFDKSYMTKSNQKPLYKTRFMLDELGNLQSEGHGISGFATMLSIGLGQEQQFTLILQTLQQLRDVYGDSVDKIVQGNTSNIVFLKSTDDSMLDTLQKMSGTTHRSFTDSKTITTDRQRLFMQQESKLSYTMTTKEVPVISYNDMAFISERNSIVFRAGDSPIWNRNETILPMSWRLFKNTIVHAGHDYSLQTIPTLSSALDFDVRKNQPDFNKMLNKRMQQAYIANHAKEAYQNAYGYSDYEIEQLDPDNYADDIMSVINDYLRQKSEKENAQADDDFDYMDDGDWVDDVEVNQEQLQATQEQQQKQAKQDQKIYAGGLLSREDLISSIGGIQHSFDKDIISVYTDVKGDFWQDTMNFSVRNGSLYGVDGKLYIEATSQSKDLQTLNDAAKDKSSNVFAESNISKEDLNALGSYRVTDDFYRFLVSQSRWTFARGKFESGMAQRMNA
jgi:hypothetical protein